MADQQTTTDGYRPDDQDEKLGSPPWKSEAQAVIAWEKAHGHDARLSCYLDGCGVLQRIADDEHDELVRLRDRIPELERQIANLEADLHSQDADYWRQRATRAEAAARGMLKFGEHEGICSNRDDASGTESCVLHDAAFNGRRDGLIAALAGAPAPGEEAEDGWEPDQDVSTTFNADRLIEEIRGRQPAAPVPTRPALDIRQVVEDWWSKWSSQAGPPEDLKADLVQRIERLLVAAPAPGEVTS